MKNSISRRLLAILLCMAMLVPYLDVLQLKAWAQDSSGPLAVVGAGTDFQYLSSTYNGVTYEDDYAANKQLFKDILERTKQEYPSLDAYLICGDYDGNDYVYETSSAGIAAAYGALNEVYGLTHDQIQFVQGNHDPADAAGLDATGAYDREHFGVYQINEDDYSWGQSSLSGKAVVEQTAAGLKAYLDEKVDVGYRKPIFIITHLPLHQTSRGDNLWGKLLADVINEAAADGLNIIYMYGHNHSGAYDKYIGGDCVYLQPGEQLLVPDHTKYQSGMTPADMLNNYVSMELGFTYLVPGYLGYVSGDLTSTVFEIYEDRVEIARYGKNGPLPLRKAGSNSDLDGDWEAVTTVVESPQTLSLSNLVPYVQESTLGQLLGADETATVQVGVDTDRAYTLTWTTMDDTVVTVEKDPDDQNKATITGVDYGSTSIKVVAQDSTDPSAIPGTLYLKVTVAPDHAVCFNDSHASGLYRLVTDWSTLGSAGKYMILNRDTAGTASALSGVNDSSNQDHIDPVTQISTPQVFALPGDTGVYTSSFNGCDQWSMVPNEDTYLLRLASGSLAFMAVTKVVDEAMSYSYPCGYRYASSRTSGGASRWKADAQSKTFSLDSYCKSGTYVDPAQSFGLYYDSADGRFEISSEATGPVSFYEWLGTEGPEIWMWLTAESGNLTINGQEVSGAQICMMTDGQVSYLPVTSEMLEGAYQTIPGTRTCTVSYNGTVLSDRFEISITAEDGTIIKPVTLMKNEGNWFRYHRADLDGQPFVTLNRKTAGTGQAMTLTQENGTFHFVPVTAEVVSFDGLDGLYVEVQDESWIWDQELVAANNSYLKNRLYGKYLQTSVPDLVLLDAPTDVWRANSTDYTLTEVSNNSIIELNNGIYSSVTRVNSAVGVGYIYVEETQLDQIVAYMTDYTGTTAMGGEGGLSSGETITSSIYYKDGHFVNEEIPLTLDMLDIGPAELIMPGDHVCTVTYQGQVITDSFLLTVEANEGEVVADTPVVYATNGQVYKFVTSMAADSDYMIVNTKTAGSAYAMSVAQSNGTYSFPAVALDTFNMTGRTETDGTNSVFAVARDESMIFSTKRYDSGSRFYLYHALHGGYLCGANTNSLSFTTQVPETTMNWRYSGTQKAVTSNFDGLLCTDGADFVLRGPSYVAADVRPQLYLRDDTVVGMVAYVDSLTGAYQVGTASTEVGGNVIIKTIFTDGAISTDTVPITVDMLEVSPESLLFPGEQTCSVVYNGVQITDEYVLTVTSDAPVPADDPVVISGSGKFYKRISVIKEFAAGGTYVLVDANTEKAAHVLAVGQNGDRYVVFGADSFVMDFDGSQYVAVKDDTWIWDAASHDFTMADGTTDTGLSLKNSGSSLYLGGNIDYDLTLNAQPSTTYAWRYASGGYAASSQGVIPEGGTGGLDLDLTYMEGNFTLATRATANANGHVYAYLPSEDVQSMVVYADALEGQCATNAPGATEVGGRVIINTMANGTVYEKEIPITQDMLGLTGEQIMIPGTYTCTLTYSGHVLSENYQLTVTGTEGDNPPAAPVVTLISADDLVFRSTGSTWSDNYRYVLVNTNVAGPASVLSVTSKDGDPAITATDGTVFAIDGSDYLYYAVKDSDLIFDSHTSVTTSGGETVTALDKLFLEHENTGKYLFVDEDLQLKLVDADALKDLPNGWRLSGGMVTGSSSMAPYAELVRQGDTFVARPRVDGSNIIRAFVLEDTINTRLAYVDSVSGSCMAGATFTTACGGNVVVKTLLEDGSCQTRVVPITLEMLDLTYSQLCVPGDYTTTLTYEGQVICQDYTLTVTPSEGERPAASLPVVLIEEGEEVYKLYTVNTQWAAGKQYVFVDTNKEGSAHMLGLASDGKGGYTSTVHDTYTFTIGGQGMYAKPDADHQIWEGCKTVATDAGSITTSAPSWMFLENMVHGRFLFVSDDYELQFVDANGLANENGWRVSTGGSLVTGQESLLPPYADVVPRGSYYIARFRKITSGNAVGTSFVYVRDDSVLTSLAYVDQITGAASIENTESYACGGNVLIKTILTDGSVVTDSVPITMDMLDLSYEEKHTPGTYTCSVIYRGEVITSDYELTIAADESVPYVTEPVALFENNGTLFKRVLKVAADKGHVFVDSKTVGSANVMSRGENDTFPAVDTYVFAIDNDTQQYVAVDQANCIWNTEWMYNQDEYSGVFTLYAADTGEYLHVDDQLQLKLVTRADAVPSGTGWHDQGAGLIGKGSSSEQIYVTIRNPEGMFVATDRYQDATEVNGAYIYQQDDTIEGQMAYITAQEGSCSTGTGFDEAINGEVIIKTFHADGNVTTQQIPVDLSMLRGIDPLDLYVPGVHTCSVFYNGQEITDNYTLTIVDEGSAAASKPIILADENSKVFKYVDYFTNGQEYVFVNTRTAGSGYALSVKEGEEGYEPDGPATVVLGNGTGALVVAESDAWIWKAETFTNGFSLYNGTIDQYLLYQSGAKLGLGTLEGATVGWRITSTQNVGDAGAAGNHDLVNNGSGFYLQSRSGSSIGHTYAYQHDDSIRMILAYMDSLSGTIEAGESGVVQPGGNVVIRTFYNNDTFDSVSIPVTLDMLDLTLTQLNTPGTYTTSVTCSGQVITQDYQITVTGEQPGSLVELPGDGNNIRGYVVLLDSNVSDVLPVASGGRIPTGSNITVFTYYSDGNVTKEVKPVTVDMLNATTEQITAPGTYSGLTLTYNNMQICQDYTLRFANQVNNDYPDFPDEGSVKVDKQMNATKYNYLQTGTAGIDLSVAGIPTTSKANVVVILDASSSMTACTHGVYNYDRLDEAEMAIVDKALARQTLTDEEKAVMLSLDWDIPDYTDDFKARQMARVKDLLNGTITDDELIALKKNMRMYGLCYQTATDSYKWVGDGDGNCKRRSIVTKEALAELLDFLQQDIEGYDMDIDIAVAYFNELYAISSDMIFLNDEPATVVPRSQDELMLPFTNSKEVVIEDVLSRYKTISGTNYDRGMEWIYQLLSEKQTADYQEYLAGDTSMPYRARKDFVLFMSDGEPGQYNYMLTNNASEFVHFYNGTIPEGKLEQYVSAENLPAFKEMYHPEGKLWLAEAIKGEKTEKYKVIDPSRPEDNYVNHISGLGATLMTVTLNAYAPVMHRIASSEDYYIPTETADDIQQAFNAFGSLVLSGSGAVFKDQMGPEFDLQMSNTIKPSNIKDMFMPSGNNWETFTGQQSTRMVYFDSNGTQWPQVPHIYTWNASGYPTGVWPGSAMTHLGNGIYAYPVPEGVSNVLFNNGGNGSQTGDLTIPSGGGYLYQYTTGSWKTYGTRTVYFDAAGCDWTNISCYTWGGSGISTTGTWPGAKMIHLGGNIYSCEIPADVTGLNFNNGNNGLQTADLKPPADERNLYRYNSGTWSTYETRTIYFNNGSVNWNQVYAYTWDENENFTTSAWPGMAMTHIGGGIYSVKVPADCERVTFHNGSGTKLENLEIPPTVIHLNPTITVSTYELYKYSEHLRDPDAVTMDMVGKRKETEPVVLEQVTFSDDGTEAYSNLIDGGKTNILIDGVICAKYFWYNTHTGKSVTIDTDHNGNAETLLESETFYWVIDSIPEDELILSYDVYLTDTLEGLREAGSYPTNDYATLYYSNHLGNDCQLDTTSPVLPWNQAAVGYAFYLVDANGNPIVNEDSQLTGSFEKAIRLTQPQYIDLLYNSDENLTPWKLAAADVLPEGYSLYDPDIAYHVALYADGEGSWEITGSKPKATTYVTGYGGVPTTQLKATAGMTTSTQSYDYPAYATSSTVVWFAVRADVNAVPDTVIIDYGISVDIHVLGNDVVITDQNSVIAGLSASCPVDSDGNGVIFTPGLAEGFTGNYTGRFGTVAIRGDVVRYTPNTLQMTAEDVFYYSANYQGTRNSGYYHASVTVIPATSIYYEDSFVTFHENWSQVGTTVSGIQDEDRLGSFNLPQIDANNVYGYDSAYANMQTWSMGSAMKATVSQPVNGNYDHSEAIAEFTFKGTGFDIISYTGTNTGLLMLTVQGITDPSYYNCLMVDSYYSMSDGLYQVPLMKVKDLPYGEYWVELYVGYSSHFDHQGDGSFDFYLDAIRIYDPANDGTENQVVQDAYVSDNEGWPSYEELRNLLISVNTFDSLGQDDVVGGVIFIDGNAALDNDNTQSPAPEENDPLAGKLPSIIDYANFGPNNELYLAPGQAIAFQLNVGGYDENIAAVHLGLKSVGGTAVTKVYSSAMNHTTVKERRVSTATGQYIDISQLNGHTVVIWNVGGEGDAIVSVTDLKTTYKHEPKNTGRSTFTINRTAAQQVINSMVAPANVQPVLKPQYPSLSFESEVLYNVYFKAENLGDVQLADLGLVTFDSEMTNGTVSDALDRIPGAVEENGLYMVHTNGIPAKNMGDALYFKVYAQLADGSYVYSDLYSYSAVDYAKSILGGNSPESLQKLCVSMLNYGAAAQTYFDYRTESLMNSWLTDAQKALAGSYDPAMIATPVQPDAAKLPDLAVGGFGTKVPSLNFGGSFTINYRFNPTNTPDGGMKLYYWTMDDYSKAERLSVDNATGCVAMHQGADGFWSAEGNPIAAKELNQTVFAMGVYTSGETQYATGILSYSAARYCAATAAGSGTLAELARATVVYGDLAASYFSGV